MKNQISSNFRQISVKAVYFIFALIGAVDTCFADTVNCALISSLPTTITASGDYCLASTMQVSLSSGAAITIAANEVTIDFNENAIVNAPSAYTAAAVGVLAEGRGNVTLKNGTLRGFRTGIRVTTSAAGLSVIPVIENMRIDRSYSVGIELSALGPVVRNCQVINTGIAYAGFPANFTAKAISLPSNQGGSSTSYLYENDILNVAAYPFFSQGACSEGVSVGSASRSLIERSRINGSCRAVSNPYDAGALYARDNVTAPYPFYSPFLAPNY